MPSTIATPPYEAARLSHTGGAKMPRQFIEPSGERTRPGSAADSGTGLPEDLLCDQSRRLQMLYASGVVLWLINLLMDSLFAPHGDRGPYRLLIEALAAVVAAVTAVYARCGRCSHRAKVDVGVFLILPHALALALLNSWMEQSTTTRPLSPITVLILFVGLLAPARPGTMLAATLISASMDPLGVWLAHLRGLPVPSPLTAWLLFYPNYVCALLAVVPARLLYRLGREIGEARARGSYHLVERLGAGGMGEVWRARHRLLARTAAIKLIRPEVLSDSSSDKAAMAVTRFEREAQATAALTSPHTIRLFDFGQTAEGTFYYVMELLEGRTLESLVREFGPLAPARAMHVVRQICHSLAEAHAIGLIHRDIKPANIYVCRMGLEYDFVKVLDFGLVKHEHGTRGAMLLTGAPIALGTPAYMAPEVILGNGGVDRRVDVYAVGCVAYFLLTGQRVFAGDTPMKTLMMHLQDMPVPPSARTEQSIPGDIDALIMACLQKDPERRPRDAEEILRLASACSTPDVWDQRAATVWWEAHLPAHTLRVCAHPAPAQSGQVFRRASQRVQIA